MPAAEARETKTGSAAGIAVKKTGRMILEALEAGGKGSITVAVACSMAGMIAGCITVTGLASKLISGVVALSSTIPNPTLSLLLALFLTMLCCIVLGMGVPTTANYCIMASTCAPILITLGIPKIAAHFFVFYFGIVADITPPVALAAYAGSAIAKSDPMKTGINATKLAIAAFIVPYMFAMNPSMLLMDQGVLAAVQVIISSCLGIFGIAAALEGYVVTRAPWWQRILLAAGGLCLIDPRLMTDLVGIAVDRDRRCAADRHAQARQARRRIKNPEPFRTDARQIFLACFFACRCARPRGDFTRAGRWRIIFSIQRFGKERSA
ncbi:MAG: TRAP transporter large permease subunit [Oscillospiraceae bacterium]